MARKGIKHKKYTEELIRELVNEKLEVGKSYSYLAKEYDIPKGTIITWVDKFKKTGSTKRKKQGRPKLNKESNYKEKYEILKKFIESLEGGEQGKK